MKSYKYSQRRKGSLPAFKFAFERLNAKEKVVHSGFAVAGMQASKKYAYFCCKKQDSNQKKARRRKPNKLEFVNVQIHIMSSDIIQ